MGVIAAILVGILGMPFFGIYLMTDKYQSENKLLGLAVTVIGISIWVVLFGAK